MWKFEHLLTRKFPNKVRDIVLKSFQIRLEDNAIWLGKKRFQNEKRNKSGLEAIEDSLNAEVNVILAREID